MKWTDRLAMYIIYVAVAAIICFIVWFFRNIVVYILVAAVLSLIGSPLISAIKKIRIKSHRIPDWAAAALVLIVIFGVFSAIVTLIVPIFTNLVREISSLNASGSLMSLSVPLQEINSFLSERFPELGADFKIEDVLVEQLQKALNVSMFSSIITSVTSFITKTGVTLFSIIFISFFFFKDQRQFSKIVAALVPDKSEKDALDALGDIKVLLSRYFLGLLSEVCAVGLINFIGLMLAARMGFNTSLSIAVITSLMNIVPYVGPIAGGTIGVIIAVVMKYTSAGAIGLDVSLWAFILILAAIFCITQLIDNYLLQPTIYSNSIKAHPLEIFIVFLMAGHLGGIIGMFVAIPAYTVIRVIAGRFLRNVKFIGRLIPDFSVKPDADDETSGNTNA